MLLVRFGILAVFVIMLLPVDPQSRSSEREGGFCDRYPNTCAASVELAGAFREKLSYGITLARRSLESRPHATMSDRQTPYGASKLDGRAGEWRAPFSGQSRGYAGDNQAQQNSASEWPRQTN